MPSQAGSHTDGHFADLAVPLTEALKEATAKAHRAIEGLAYSQALMAGRLSRADYGFALGQLRHVHAALEAQLATHEELAGDAVIAAESAAGHGPLASGFSHALEDSKARPLPGRQRGPLRLAMMSRTATIDADLAVLGCLPPPPVNAEAQKLAERFTDWGRQRPAWSLLGALYVYEGSRLGSLMLAAKLATCLGVNHAAGCGLDYHLEGAAERGRIWKQFKADLDALTLGETDRAAIVEAAVETFERTVTLYESFAVSATS